MHIPRLVKIHWCLLKLSSGNEKRTDRRMDGLADDQRETIIPRHYCVAGYKNGLTICKQLRPWSDATFCGVWSGSALFAVPFYGSPDYNGLTCDKALAGGIIPVGRRAWQYHGSFPKSCRDCSPCRESRPLARGQPWAWKHLLQL